MPDALTLPTSHELIRRLERALSEPIYITSSIAVWCPASIGVADTRTVGYDSAALLAHLRAGLEQGAPEMRHPQDEAIIRDARQKLAPAKSS